MLDRDWFEGNSIPYNDGKTFAEIMILNLNTGSMRVRLYESEDSDAAFASNVELITNK